MVERGTWRAWHAVSRAHIRTNHSNAGSFRSQRRTNYAGTPQLRSHHRTKHARLEPRPIKASTGPLLPKYPDHITDQNPDRVAEHNAWSEQVTDHNTDQTVGLEFTPTRTQNKTDMKKADEPTPRRTTSDSEHNTEQNNAAT